MTRLLWLTSLFTCAVASGLFLIGPCKKEDASKLCKLEGMKLATVNRASLAEVDGLMAEWDASGIWAGHKTEGVAVYSGNGRLNKCKSAGGKLLVLCQGSCHGGHCKRSRAPRSSKRVAKRILRKGIKEAKPGYKCCYSHSDSWASTHVSQEIKTRIPVRRHRHVYKSSSSSCTSSSSCPPCSESTSVTTEEIVRPHKRTYYKKNVKVKDEVCPKEIRQEVRKKCPPACEEPCPPKEPSSCSESVSYSASSSSDHQMRSSSHRRLYKRSFGDDEPELKKTLKALHNPSRRFNKLPGKTRGDGRAPIRFPSSHSSSSSSSCSESSSESIELKYKVRKEKEREIPYVKLDGKLRKVRVIGHNEMPKEPVGTPNITTNDTSKTSDKTEEPPTPAETTPEPPTECKTEDKPEEKPQKCKPKVEKPKKCKSKKAMETKPKSSKHMGSKGNVQNPVCKHHSMKPIRRSQMSSIDSCQSEEVKVVIKRNKSKKHRQHKCSKSSCSGSHRHRKNAHKHLHHKHEHKHRHHHHHKHSHQTRSQKHGSSGKEGCQKCHRYKSKTARKTRVTPISTSSGSKHPVPLVLRKKHVRVK